MGQVNTATRARRRMAMLAAVALVPALALGLTACGGGNEAATPQVISEKGTPFGDLLVPKLTSSVKDGAVGVSVDSPVTVSAEFGVLGAVSMVNEDGKAVQGRLSKDGLTWETSEPLGYNKRYTLTAESLGLGGVASRQMTFETHSPENLTMPYVLPAEGEVVGVGQPVAVRFDENITNRLAAQRAITVKTTPSVEGAFYWLSNREVRWRPAEYWKPGTKVEVSVDTYGVDLGDGLFGQENVSTNFTIGDQVITTVDDDTKTLTVRRNGEVIKSMPVSMGKNSTPTNNGTYIVGDRRAHMVMDSSTYGVPAESPNGYRTEVDWATQISYSGIYVHAAPWSVGSQGYSNVSHGCINVSTSNGQWFYNNAKRGDIVEIVNTVGSPLPGTDGLGDWNIPWEQWKAGNANV
ncbi:MAG: L,D-transpeptidase [Mycolicibacterium rufum]|uniref:Putative L,D-transpeptidase LppS n=1 Tax=Mycolicibacterium chlorophenolicum TaxID=37916 RepID=A0A0J6Y6B7_9MYCO|nr:Ig-like domain-containing protein [Mycolicibacterium chlorophenolicum]KMO68591.1 putative L,D-transpeptidase LppS precursor [Mycolicibacterium chlorophenolicum]MBI5341266.1 L,D-transpeptidase [Mycolicibacterium rufum]